MCFYELPPSFVDKERLKEANSMSQMVNGICTVLGPMFGAVAISWFGLPYVFLFNGMFNYEINAF